MPNMRVSRSQACPSPRAGNHDADPIFSMGMARNSRRSTPERRSFDNPHAGWRKSLYPSWRSPPLHWVMKNAIVRIEAGFQRHFLWLKRGCIRGEAVGHKDSAIRKRLF